MACKHPNAKLTLSWTEEATIAGAEVETYRVGVASLRVIMRMCPDCGLSGVTYTAMDGWRERWPVWLQNRVRQLAESHAPLRLAVRTCLPGLVSDSGE